MTCDVQMCVISDLQLEQQLLLALQCVANNGASERVLVLVRVLSNAGDDEEVDNDDENKYNKH